MRYVVLVALAACYCPQRLDDLALYGERWTEGDALFHLDARWLGGDGAYSIALDDDRTLWLFGDSFIATTAAVTRREAVRVRSSVAVMHGHDPSTATMQFAWRGEGSAITSFFPDDVRPTGGTRAPDGSVLVFLAVEPNAGWRAVRIPDTHAPPASWTIEPAITRPSPYAQNAAVACSTVDDDHVVAVFVSADDRTGRLARWTLDEVARGDLSSPAWWSGTQWVTEAQLAAAPAIVFRDAERECSIASDGAGGFLHVENHGATFVGRRAWKITGPYAKPQAFLTAREAQVPDAVVYGAKAHPHLGSVTRMTAEGRYVFDLVVTFSDSRFDLLSSETEKTVFWPHLALIAFVFPSC